MGNCAISASTETAYAAYVGIDWGTATHQVAVLDAQRAPLGERAVAHDGVALQAFTEWLTLLTGGEPARVAVALEVPRGAVVDTLLERGFHVFALNPKQLDLVERQRRDCARRIEHLLDALATTREHQGHRDVTILRSLPGVGRVVAATMLAEASRLLAARDYHGLRTQAGVAPVTRQSGKRLLVGMRYACNPRLRNALYYWGFISVRYDALSRHHYRRLRGHGHSHGRALRGVVDRLLTVLMAMLAPMPASGARTPVRSE